MTVADCFLMSYVWAHFTLSPHRHHWVRGVCMFRCSRPPALLAEWPEPFTCHCSNTGVEWAPNKSQHKKLALEKKISCSSCQDSNSQPFTHESGAVRTSCPGSRASSKWDSNDVVKSSTFSCCQGRELLMRMLEVFVLKFKTIAKVQLPQILLKWLVRRFEQLTAFPSTLEVISISTPLAGLESLVWVELSVLISPYSGCDRKGEERERNTQKERVCVCLSLYVCMFVFVCVVELMLI